MSANVKIYISKDRYLNLAECYMFIVVRPPQTTHLYAL